MIVTCSNNQKDMWSNELKAHLKYRVQKCFKLNNIKYYTGQILYQLPEGYNYAE